MPVDSAEVRATLAFAEETGVASIPERIRTLPRRLERPLRGVALLGLVNRGKSTLFNRLIGLELSPVAATPETAATIAVSPGLPSANGFGQGGHPIDLPTAPEEFTAAVQRGAGTDLTLAWYTGSTRLAAGLTLIDTPGINDVAIDNDDSLERLALQWRDAGASAAVIVLSVPPGPSANDKALVAHAQSAFPGAVRAVCKATSSAVDPDDVVEVAEHASSAMSIDVLPLPDEAPTTSWGHGPLGALEGILLDVAETGANRLSTDVETYQRFVRTLISALDETSLADIDTLATAPGRHHHLPASLKRAARQRADTLRRQQEDARLAERQRAEQERRSALDASALRLIDSAGSSADTATRQALIGQLRELAQQGSGVAARELTRLAKSGQDSLFGELRLTQLAPILPADQTIEIVRGRRVDDNELLATARSPHAPLEVRREAQFCLLKRLSPDPSLSTPPSEQQITEAKHKVAELHKEAVDNRVRLKAAREEAKVRLRALECSATTVPHSTEQAASRIAEARRDRDIIRARAGEDQAPLMWAHQADELLLQTVDTGCMPLRVMLARHFHVVVQDPRQWIISARQTIIIAEQWLNVGKEMASELRVDDWPALEWLRFDIRSAKESIEHWPHEAQQAQRTYAARLNKSRQRQSLYQLLQIGSVVLLFLISLVYLGPLVELALALIGIGIVGWVLAGSVFSEVAQQLLSAILALNLSLAVWLLSLVGAYLGAAGQRRHAIEGNSSPHPAPLATPPSLPLAGWYILPGEGDDNYRWWDGYRWYELDVLTPIGSPVVKRS